MNMQKLPVDLINEICKRIHVQDILHVSQTCKELHKKIQDEKIWQTLCEGVFVIIKLHSCEEWAIQEYSSWKQTFIHLHTGSEDDRSKIEFSNKQRTAFLKGEFIYVMCEPHIRKTKSMELLQLVIEHVHVNKEDPEDCCQLMVSVETQNFRTLPSAFIVQNGDQVCFSYRPKSEKQLTCYKNNKMVGKPRQCNINIAGAESENFFFVISTTRPAKLTILPNQTCTAILETGEKSFPNLLHWPILVLYYVFNVLEDLWKFAFQRDPTRA